MTTTHQRDRETDNTNMCIPRQQKRVKEREHEEKEETTFRPKQFSLRILQKLHLSHNKK